MWSDVSRGSGARFIPDTNDMTPSDRNDLTSPTTLEPVLSWHGILRAAFAQLGGTASVSALYLKLERELFPRTQLSSQTRTKIRETLMKDPRLQRISRQTYRLRTEDAGPHATKPRAKHR